MTSPLPDTAVLRDAGPYARLGGELLFLGLFLAAASLFSGEPWSMLGIVLAILVARFAVLGVADFRFFLLGVLLGGGNDLMSMIRGVYAYDVPHPGVPWPMPLWMFLFWGQVFLVMRTVFALPWLRGPRPTRGLWPPGSALIIDLVAVVLMRIVVYSTYDHPVVPGVLLSVILVFTYVLHGMTASDAKLMLVTLIAGPFVEWVLISADVYDYMHPFVVGMPAWLLVWWLFATPLLKRIFDRMDHQAPSPNPDPDDVGRAALGEPA